MSDAITAANIITDAMFITGYGGYANCHPRST